MAADEFHYEYTLAKTAEKLGKKASQLNLTPSFAARYFADIRQYYIPDEIKSEPLTPEEVYMRLRQLLEDSGN
ncbi:hypothetical protein [Nostoc parmelioides]|uniref:Uncharacterized protein n=1 Tax=Nostoc parmelioides FACHB-3921 TaxID=2692909 RepID=A0ABR8BQ11_9NOSO|nr:hypothetical protein [Nostoc parmelioides]MBD2255709.1 hypothetical protein [Nostoc parmelioides FACHB-3921]